MKLKIKIWHFLLVVLGIILVLRFSFFVKLVALFGSFLTLILNNFEISINQLDWTLFDYFLSVILLIILPLLLYLLKNRLKVLNLQLSSLNLVIIFLILFSIFAPIFTPSDPNFQHDISVAKLLPPLSEKTIVKVVSDEKENKPIDEFIRMKRNLKPALNDEYIYVVDDYKIENGITFFQNRSSKTITQTYLDENKMILEIDQILFLLGTDEYGRDIFSRIIYGTRLSLLIGFFSVIISFVIGISLGFISGFFGGIADTILNRIAEMFMAFPMIFLIILIVAFFGSSLTVIIFVLGFSGWMDLFKIVRGEVLSLKGKDFIITAKMLGQSKYWILYKEMFPLMLSPIIVHLVFQYSNVIIAESALSYLGLGLGNQYASWGSMIEAGQYYLSQAWWMSLFPCIFLFITLISLNNLGKKFEGLLDPRLS